MKKVSSLILRGGLAAIRVNPGSLEGKGILRVEGFGSGEAKSALWAAGLGSGATGVATLLLGSGEVNWSRRLEFLGSGGGEVATFRSENWGLTSGPTAAAREPEGLEEVEGIEVLEVTEVPVGPENT